MNDWLVLRFGSLGDLCLLGWSLSALSDHPDGAPRRVTLVTKAPFADLAAAFRGVDEVAVLEGKGLAALGAVAGPLRRRRWAHIVDAHHVLRSHALLVLLGRGADARLAKDTTARLRLLAGGGAADPRLALTMVDRFDAVLGLTESPESAPPASSPRHPPLAALATTAPTQALGLAPGARWATKRWPERHWLTLIEGLAAAGERDLRIFLGPDETAWYAGSALAGAAASAGARVIAGRSLVEVARELAACRAVATNDSGLLHVAEATGTPVLAFFGPTVRAFGYYPRLPQSRVLERELECRPCSRNGRRPCHRGDLACLEAIEPQTALALLRSIRRPT